jgi:2-dehydro-3-deoxy-D-arabinonate dehydratase
VEEGTLQATSLRPILFCMKLYRSRHGILAEHAGHFYNVNASSWDELAGREDLLDYLRRVIRETESSAAGAPGDVLPPIGSQEVWAAGVTYYRSRSARMEESKDAGGGSFYDRVYVAERPELFFKSPARDVVGHRGQVRIRRDAKWSVPEPELTLLINHQGRIIGYTAGNDMSSRDIEGENPLYLPQAKVYEGSCALGPCVLVNSAPLPSSTAIQLKIQREGRVEFSGGTTLAELKREPAGLAGYLFRENKFPAGCFLMTGTGIVPPDSFTLQPGDEVHITIDAIGTLVNRVA